jgi:hypothetical protein
MKLTPEGRGRVATVWWSAGINENLKKLDSFTTTMILAEAVKC